MKEFLSDVISQYRSHKHLAERAIAQVANDADLFVVFGGGENSIAMLIKDVSGMAAQRVSGGAAELPVVPYAGRSGGDPDRIGAWSATSGVRVDV